MTIGQVMEGVAVVAMAVSALWYGVVDSMLPRHRDPRTSGRFALPGPLRWRADLYSESGWPLVKSAWRAFGMFILSAVAFLLVRLIRGAA